MSLKNEFLADVHRDVGVCEMSGKSSHVYPVTYSILAKYDLYNSHLTGFPLASRIIFFVPSG